MSVVKKYIGDLFLNLRFYVAVGGCAVFYIIAFFFPALLPVASVIFPVICILVFIDYVFLFMLFKAPLASRKTGDRWSNGDENDVRIDLQNRMPFVIDVRIIDELPSQFQERSFLLKRRLSARQKVSVKYSLTPAQRGTYQFGNLLLFIQSQLGLLRRRTSISAEELVRVYPSFMGAGKQAIMAQALTHEQGSRRMRKIGHSMEFEQIKDYVSGDDIRTINWKATARRGQLMINNYVDEKSQSVYCIIDKGRLMKMPFKGLSLLDYAINASLALTNVCLRRQDRIGLISFSNKFGSVIAADRRPVQRESIMQALYKEETGFLESDMELLYMQVRKNIKQRSLLILFTNFESLNGLKRQMNYLRAVAKYHLLLVVFFENTELTKLSGAEAHNLEDVYVKTVADKLSFEKRLVVKELQKHGILSVLSTPQSLTTNTINKYLELKARQAV